MNTRNGQNLFKIFINFIAQPFWTYKDKKDESNGLFSVLDDSKKQVMANTLKEEETFCSAVVTSYRSVTQELEEELVRKGKEILALAEALDLESNLNKKDFS